MSQPEEVRHRKKQNEKKDVIDPEFLAKEKKRMRNWIHSEENKREKERDDIKKQTQASSDNAVKIVGLVWVALIIGIFYHVFSTINLGRRYNNQGPLTAWDVLAMPFASGREDGSDE